MSKVIVDGKKPDVEKVIEARRLYRRKPLLVEAEAGVDGSWQVLEAGRQIKIGKEEFDLLYELVEIEPGKAVDAGLPDLEPGQQIEHLGRKLLRVVVVAGRGACAYWHQNKPTGKDCQYKVVADQIEDPQASHFAGRFVEPWEGRSALDSRKTWIILPLGR